jgi:ferrous iron transport protein B
MNAAPLVALVGNPNAAKAPCSTRSPARGKRSAIIPASPSSGIRAASSWTMAARSNWSTCPVPIAWTPAAWTNRSRNVVMGSQAGERRPDALVVVVDAANLDNHLRFALQLIALGLPVVVALNMVDLAERDGLTLDAAAWRANWV